MIWKKHPVYSSYLFSEKGNIYSLLSGKILKTGLSNSGYYCTPLRHNGKYKNIFIHRELARIFIGKTDKMDVNHINGIKTDNRLCNLEVITRRENLNHALKTGLRKTKYSKELIENIREDLRLGIRQVDICAKYSVNKYLVFDIKHGRSRNVV